jgi:hypothetical protein
MVRFTPGFLMFGFSGMPVRSPIHRSVVKRASRLRDGKEIDPQAILIQ